MIVSDLDISIKDYLGMLEGGVSVVLSIKYQEEIYEGIYWFDKKHKILTVDSELEKIIGQIEKYEGYDDIISELDKETPDFDDIKGQLSTI